MAKGGVPGVGSFEQHVVLVDAPSPGSDALGALFEAAHLSPGRIMIEDSGHAAAADSEPLIGELMPELAEEFACLTEAHKAARSCQGLLTRRADEIKKNLVLGREASRGIADVNAKEAHEKAAQVYEAFPEFCGRNCFAAILGTCPVAAEAVTAVELAEFLAGDTPPQVKGSRKSRFVTTPVLQVTDRILGTTLLDRPTPAKVVVRNGARDEYQRHAAATVLGRKAHVTYQPHLVPF